MLLLANSYCYYNHPTTVLLLATTHNNCYCYYYGYYYYPTTVLTQDHIARTTEQTTAHLDPDLGARWALAGALAGTAAGASFWSLVCEEVTELEAGPPANCSPSPPSSPSESHSLTS